MQSATEDTFLQKTRELCQTLLDQPEIQTVRRRVDAFMADELAKNQYQLVSEQGEALQQKQQLGLPMNETEIAEFEKNRQSLLGNPVARDFLDAQQEMHRVQQSVLQYVIKTLELGRVPAPEDFDSGSCGPSCGCGH
jgi:cell fate (sporulation/competence/biofilm development) regulator YlbF (YheA/YmcA/DUF963 family)